MQTIKKRLPEFDIAKAIALLAVIVGHCSFAGVPQTIVDACYSFDMPLFFIVSGYFCHFDAKLNKAYVEKNARSLLLPYVFTCVLVIIFAVFFSILTSIENPIDTASKWIKASLYGAGGIHPGMPSGVIGIGAIWYLWALFWSKLLLAEINTMPHPFIYSIALFIVGISTNGIIWLPFSIQNAFCAILFLHIGQYIRKFDLLNQIKPLLWIAATFTTLYCAAFYGQLYMQSNSFQHGLIDIVGGVCAALCVIKLSKLLADKVPVIARPFEMVGSHTLPLFCMHLTVLNVVPWNIVISNFNTYEITPWIGVLFINLTGAIILTSLLWLILPKNLRKIYFTK